MNKATRVAAELMNAWTSGINSGRSDAVAALFAPDALFMATEPEPLLGREAIRGYYQRIPEGLQVFGHIVLADIDAHDLLRAIMSVSFTLPDGAGRSGTVTLAACLAANQSGWHISLYHAALGPATN